MARDLVGRNVVELCGVPRGQAGRPSKSLTLAQASSVLAAAARSTLIAYVVLSLLLGARTEELRALRWDHVDLEGAPDATPPVPPSVHLWRSVREGGDTKTKRSRRTLALPGRCVAALRKHLEARQVNSAAADGLVFATRNGTELAAGNVRRSFRRVVAAAGLDPASWTPRELRHSFVSLMSLHGVTVEQIADLVGHAGTIVTETVYRHELRPVLLAGATVMDEIFPTPGEAPDGRDGA
jgi:integrase